MIEERAVLGADVIGVDAVPKGKSLERTAAVGALQLLGAVLGVRCEAA